MRLVVRLTPTTPTALRSEATRHLRLALSRYAGALVRVRLFADGGASTETAVELAATLRGGAQVTLSDRDLHAETALARACNRLARLISLSLDTERLEGSHPQQSTEPNIQSQTIERKLHSTKTTHVRSPTPRGRACAPTPTRPSSPGSARASRARRR